MSSIILRPDPVRSNHEPFAAVAHAIAADPRLSAVAVRVYAAVLYFLRDRPSCRPTNADLGRRACCSVATVKRSLAALEAVGVIGRVPDDNPTGRRLVVHRRATPRLTAEPPPAHGRATPRLTDEPPPGSRVSHSEEAGGERRNVTGVPLPETTTASPGRPQEPRPEVPTAPRPSAPVRPLLDELKALPGAEGPKVRSLAWRLAHHLGDVASIGFFALVLGLVARGATPLQRLLDAFRVADRARGKARKPGAIFASAWTGWQPPPLPGAIHRPTYSQAPRPPTTPPTGAPPLPRPEPSTTPPPEPEVAVEWSPELLARWERIVAHPDHPEARTARVMLAAYRAEAATRACTPSAADPDE